MTDSDVADYMINNFNGIWLIQEVIARKIKKECGDDFVYKNENGNLAISKKVLKEFKGKTEGLVVWDRGNKSWKKLSSNEQEKYSGRQVE